MSAPERACGACHVCCVALAIPEEPRIGPKEMGEPCPHLRASGQNGCCGIYPRRPRLCQEWRCAWRTGHFPENARPDRSGVLAWGYENGDWPVMILDGRAETEERALAMAAALEDEGCESVRLVWAEAYVPGMTQLDRWRRYLMEWLVWLRDTRETA